MANSDKKLERSNTGGKGAATRQAILQCAMDLASTNGMGGLSIGTLARELRISKSGLFAHFGSKEELQLATIKAARSIFIARVVEPALKAPKGLARLEAVLINWLDYASEEVFPGGCFFSTTLAESASKPGPVRDLLSVCLNDWSELLLRLIKESNELPNSLEPKQLVFEFNAVLMASNNLFQLHRDSISFARAYFTITERLGQSSLAPQQFNNYLSRGNK